MAQLTYTVTVASGNLYGGGTGNVFYLDGARNSTGPGTVSWVNGGTLRFEQSNASNDNHPLIFSLMDPMPGAIDAITKLDDAYELYLLSTAPWDNPNAWKQKRDWVQILM